MIRLLLADDHAIFRQGLTRLLHECPEVQVVAETGDGGEAWGLIQSQQPDIAIVDIEMPRIRGIELVERVREAGLSTRVLLLTMHDEPMLALDAERAGCDGYVLKDNTFEELLKAIKTVAGGRRYVSPSVIEKSRVFREGGRGATLSPRELEVLRLIASGLSTKSIARELNISPKTVETHRNRLMLKLNLHSVADLVRYAIQSGLYSE